MAMTCAVYILASKQNGTLYTGVTTDLIKRVYQHKTHYFRGFTEKYKVTTLVYFELCDEIESAIAREKYIKGKNRKFKIGLIQKANPDWNDLWQDIT